MVKRIFLMTISILAAVALIGQQEPLRELNFDKLDLVGRVLDEQNQPLANIKVEIRLAYDSQTQKPEIAEANFTAEEWQILVSRCGSGIFGWAITDVQGAYRIAGVPKPGAFFLLVRNPENHVPATVPVVLERSGLKEVKADIILRRSETVVPKISPKAMEEIQKAKQAVQENKLAEAAACLNKAIAIEPGFAESHYNLAIILRQLGKLDDAVAALEKAVALNANYHLARLALAEIFYSRNDYTTSKNQLVQLLASPGYETMPAKSLHKVYYLLGTNLHNLKEFERSNEYLAKYRELAAAFPEENSSLAMAGSLSGINHFNLKQYDKAIPLLNRSIELEPKLDGNVYIMLANSYVISRDGPNAIRVYQLYLDRFPEAANAAQVKAILAKLKEMYPQK